MRRLNLTVFDEFITNAILNAGVFTSQERLGQYDQLAIFAVVDNIEHAQQSRLQLERHLADLVEEQRSASHQPWPASTPTKLLAPAR